MPCGFRSSLLMGFSLSMIGLYGAWEDWRMGCKESLFTEGRGGVGWGRGGEADGESVGECIRDQLEKQNQ